MKTSTQETKSIDEIIKAIDEKKLVLPEFQRDFKWSLEKSEILFDSIFKDLFIGSLIVSKPKFDLVCRGFDVRKRGSKARKPSKDQYKKEDFEHHNIYTLLDGQQRVTALYRAFKGYDEIYLIFKKTEDLKSSDFYDANTCDVLGGFEDYIQGFDSIKPDCSKTFYLKISDLFSYVSKSEKAFTIGVLNGIISNLDCNDSDRDVLENYGIKLFSDFKSDILKKNLLSVQLLDMDLEKFCLYFERSNSQGLNLSFTDIVTAKIYLKFNLRKAIDDAVKNNRDYFNENLVDPLVRYINFKDHREVTKKSILEQLKGESFQNHWDNAVHDIIKVQQWLETSKWVFKVENIPYKTMLLPLLAFYQNLPNKDFSQASDYQLQTLKFWFYASIFDNRYGGARHGSTNVVIKKDCETLEQLAALGKVKDIEYWGNFRIDYNEDEFIRIDSNNNAKFLAVNYLMWNNRNFKNFENSENISIKSEIDVHHFYPSNYLKKTFGDSSDEYDKADSILNKVRINKISNIKIKDKAPSVYLNEILELRVKDSDPEDKLSRLVDEKNKLIGSLETHCIPFSEELLKGEGDRSFEEFLKARYQLFEKYLKSLNEAHLNIKTGQSQIWY
ncbi:GmrSD restriction endonuclease domain-containing protein [Acinetobacter beijerinckii]|uniref:GmrSD restriction endonuclease domain-containing protein n=1 Tax=Acinetobacter beijerinckii TaxID=262668 RepID=UPI003AF4BE90